MLSVSKKLSIYISSTYEDLQEHRERVYNGLRALRHNVIAMEDYVASDRRSLDQCLADIRESDVYVGIFAWRYGFVPAKDNPQKRSITELELREAIRLDKPRLLFLLKADAPWRPPMSDMMTGENRGGTRISALREFVNTDRLPGIFETPDELALKVVTALQRWQSESSTPAEEGLPSRARVVTTDAAPTPQSPAGDSPLWPPGSQLRVRFLDGSPQLQSRVLRLAQVWSAFANISFI